MKWFNSNAVHNLLNFIITIVAGGALVGFDWTLFGIDDADALKITGCLSLLKLLINAYRDGLPGMVEAPPSPRATQVARQVDANVPASDPVLIVTPEGEPNIVVPGKSS